MTKIDINDFVDMQRQHEQMLNYVKANGFIPVGPVIQKSQICINEDIEPEVSIYLLQQINGFIGKPQSPYISESVIRIPNCLYTRFSGNSEDLRFAYDKINLMAYEEELEMGSESYTVFVDENDEQIVADVFVEQINHE